MYKIHCVFKSQRKVGESKIIITLLYNKSQQTILTFQFNIHIQTVIWSYIVYPIPSS